MPERSWKNFVLVFHQVEKYPRRKRSAIKTSIGGDQKEETKRINDKEPRG